MEINTVIGWLLPLPLFFFFRPIQHGHIQLLTGQKSMANMSKKNVKRSSFSCFLVNRRFISSLVVLFSALRSRQYAELVGPPPHCREWGHEQPPRCSPRLRDLSSRPETVHVSITHREPHRSEPCCGSRFRTKASNLLCLRISSVSIPLAAMDCSTGIS